MAGSQQPGGRGPIGPVLFFHGAAEGRAALAAVAICREDAPQPVVEAGGRAIAPQTVLRRAGRRVVRWAFDLPMAAATGYAVDGAWVPVSTGFGGDLRLAYVSCNGRERGDLGRDLAERNAMWRRLGAAIEARPAQLLLQGGDQLYADEVVEAHPLSAAWARGETADPGPEALAELREALAAAYLDRYAALYAQPEVAHVMVRVPTLAMWDDHDIVDGWGSLPEARLDAPVGRALFAAAREAFLIFQLGAAPGALPGQVLDREGASLGWHAALPGLDIVAPDLRSERRPDRVMGPAGWAGFERALARAQGARLLVMSSVPAVGPRLSWVERAMQLTRRMEKYEDDLRDQWQSRAHRAEWRRFLSALAALHERPGRAVTLVSGEIHLATHGTMATAAGPLHQLVASGIAHPVAPRLYALGLGALAALGEAPLPRHPLRLHPLPGQRRIYAAERNFLWLERRDGAWQAVWELEESGTSPALPL